MNEDLILSAQSYPLLISILLLFILPMEPVMSQARLWSINNTECSCDFFCFGNKVFFQIYCPHFPIYTCLQSPSVLTKI